MEKEVEEHCSNSLTKSTVQEYKSFVLSVNAWSKKTNTKKNEYVNKFFDHKIMRLNIK